MSPEKATKLENEVACHLEMLQNKFRYGHMNENTFINNYDTNPVFNMNTRHTLRFKSDETVQYAPVTSSSK